MTGETITDQPERNVVLLAGHPEVTVTWSRYAPGEKGPDLHVHHAFRNDGVADARWLNFHVPDKGFAEYMRGARDGRQVPWDSFDRPADGGLPADEVTLTATGGARLPELLVRPGHGVVHVEAGGRRLAVET